MTTLPRITANAPAALTVTTGAAITASAPRRMLTGDVVRYGVVGRTSRGPLRVRPGALRFPDPLHRVKLTKEHNRDESRGWLHNLDATDTGIRASMRAADGPEGDAALREADPNNPVRDGFSFDVVDATIEAATDGGPDWITDALVVAIGQVGIPAYDDMRIDTIAASQTPAPSGPTTGGSMTPEQIARLAELRAAARETMTPEQIAELDTLAALEGSTDTPAAPAEAPAAPAATASVAASMPSVPGGVPTRGPVTTRPTQGTALRDFVRTVCAGYGVNRDPGAITAALADITHAAHSDNVSAPGWSGELWSGVAFEPEFDLLNTGDLTNYEGKGWRWVVKPLMQDYAGNKAAIPTNVPTTEPAGWEAARMAVGHDIDRKFYDFPDEGFLTSYVEAVRESAAMQFDEKRRAYIVANAVPATIGGVAVPEQTSVLKAAGKAVRALRRNRVGAASFVLLSDNDFDTLMDIAEKDVPAFLDLFGIDPRNFKSAPGIADGSVVAGVKQSATFRTLPGSPIRVDAQHLANGGVDSAFFAYWAIEQHHETGIVSVDWAAPVAP